MDEHMESNYLTFKGQILGFEATEMYKLYPLEEDFPFFYFQSAESEYPCFVLCDPIYFLPDYQVDYSIEIQEDLEAESIDELRCLAIVTIPDSFENITVNLKSPVIFNIKKYRSKQFVLDNVNYSIRHKLFISHEVVD